MDAYDSDKQYPVFGFGGRTSEINTTQHCFALNGDIFNPEVNGIQGVLDVYRNSIRRARLSGPTKFSEILRYVNGYCKAKEAELSQHN